LHHVVGLQSQLNLLNTAYDTGIRYFDTAPLYGHGNAERTLGQFARKHRSQSSLVIATKVGLVPNPLVSRFPKLLFPYIALRKATIATHIFSPSSWQPKRNYSSSYLIQRVELSLRALRLDYLDVVLLHEPTVTELQAMDSLNEAVLSLKQRGLVRAFGISAQLSSAQWLQDNLPGLAEIIQVEIPSQLTEVENNWIAENATATFGHFRLQSSVQPHISSDNHLIMVANRAVELNPKGTILFSSTNNAHIKSFVTAIEAADKKKFEVKHVN